MPVVDVDAHLGEDQIFEYERVNAIVPGPTDTPLVAARLEEPSVLDRIEQGTPLGRIGAPDDLTGIAVYLASDESRFATGALFVVDGGWLVA